VGQGVLGATPATWPLEARGQQPTMPIIGFLGSESPDLGQTMYARSNKVCAKPATPRVATW
jgi:hypothetical protein